MNFVGASCRKVTLESAFVGWLVSEQESIVPNGQLETPLPRASNTAQEVKELAAEVGDLDFTLRACVMEEEN